MKTDAAGRLLSIGEFAAATQLSLKALRLYDEQRLLRPATIDTTNGYRYYRHDQIETGRLIRLLRDMELPLAAVADIVANDITSAEAVLRQFAQDLEQRFARNAGFTAPLTGITAAVVGVILNLAVFFAYHVLWPNGFVQPLAWRTLFAGFESISALIDIAAFIALWRFRIGVIPVIGACALAGLFSVAL
jgi:DNA-binding transcriptional MerR regulator